MNRDTVQRYLRETGLKPQRAAGQHFLMDETVVARMMKAAKVNAKDTILEIGPGFGVLTEALLNTGATVIAVELDTRLAEFLTKRLSARKNLTLITSDIFRVRLDQLLQDLSYKLVANLPYSATSLVFRNFLQQPPRPTSITVLIQKEVAERIVASPGKMSMLSLMTQYYSQPALLFPVPKTSFFPAPAVTSAVLHASNVSVHPDEEVTWLFRTARAGFSAKRKQLHNSLASSFHLPPEKVADILLKTGIPPTIRPQDLTLAQWLELAHIFHRLIKD